MRCHIVLFPIAAAATFSAAAGWPWDWLHLTPLAHSGPAGSSSPPLVLAKILRCHDGDTCTARFSNKQEVRLRFIGIDAPELGKNPQDAGQPHSKQSRDALVQKIGGRNIQARIWNTDRYGRSLAEIFLEGENINVWLVQTGQAEVYRGQRDTPLPLQAYFSAELNAQRQRLGVWANATYESPRIYRQTLSLEK